jgi:proteasome lid subunit RPN8/RPN11
MADIKFPPITITSKHQNQMISEAAELSPFESCGLLAGYSGVVKQILRITNINPDPSGFIMDPKELVKAFHSIEAAGRQLVGMYHSHPRSTPFPSETDIMQCNYPDTPQLIIGKNQGKWEIRAFIIQAGGHTEIDLIFPPG